MKILQTFGLGETPTQNTAVVTQPTQQTSIGDLSNIRYPRTFVLNNGFVILSHGTTSAGIALADLALALVTLEPTLTWPPIAVTQPQSQEVTAPTPVAFQFVVNSEVSVTYQWYESTDGGNTWNPLSDTGVYSGTTTFQLSISDSTGLTGNQYRCTAQNANPTILTSAAATLTVN
jgi:hypothetical protein